MALKFEDVRDKIESGVYKLAMNDKSTRSTVWRVYRKIEKDDGSFIENVLYCIGCKSIMSFVHKSTTNLRRHRCHLQYLKKQALYGYKPTGPSKTEPLEMDSESANEELEDKQSIPDEMEIKPSVVDVAALVAEVDSGGRFSGVPTLVKLPHQHQDVPEFSLPPDISGSEESNIYAQTWSLEYRKLSEDQKFYAKKAIDEIFVLGRLRRLTLNTVPTADLNI
ncbi:hypothetical protein KR038_001700 [Drosophila bunnanda]|nr:hypothetical protein KR038_001700 [Drosophila bunnanda]